MYPYIKQGDDPSKLYLKMADEHRDFGAIFTDKNSALTSRPSWSPQFLVEVHQLWVSFLAEIRVQHRRRISKLKDNLEVLVAHCDTRQFQCDHQESHLSIEDCPSSQKLKWPLHRVNWARSWFEFDFYRREEEEIIAFRNDFVPVLFLWKSRSIDMTRLLGAFLLV